MYLQDKEYLYSTHFLPFPVLKGFLNADTVLNISLGNKISIILQHNPIKDK